MGYKFQWFFLKTVSKKLLTSDFENVKHEALG